MSTSGPRLGDEQPAIAPHETPITTPMAMRMMPVGACRERPGNREGHGMNRILFKQLLQARAIPFCQIDSCRLGGVNENLAVLLLAAKFGVPVCPQVGLGCASSFST